MRCLKTPLYVALPTLLTLTASSVLAAPCDPSTADTCSDSDAVDADLSVESLSGLGDGPKTDWFPNCDSKTEPCDEFLQLQAGFSFPKPAGKTYEVVLPKDLGLNVNWGDPANPDKFVVTLAAPGGATAAGLANTNFSMSPDLGLAIGCFDGNAVANAVGCVGGLLPFGPLEFGVAELINYIPNTAFAYEGIGQATITDWAFAPVTWTSTDAVGSTQNLINIDLLQLVGLIAGDISVVTDNVGIELALNANPTLDFSYATSKVTLEDATDSASADLTAADAMAVFDIKDANQLEINVTPAGTFAYSGDVTLSLDLGVALKGSGTLAGLLNAFIETALGSLLTGLYEETLDVPRTTSEIELSTYKFVVPLPNVKVPDALAAVEAEVGASVTVTLEMENTGKREAMLTLSENSDEAKLSTESLTLEPESTKPVTLTFSPTAVKNGKVTVTVESNDPDSPVQTFDVTVNGVESPAADPTMGAGGSGGGETSGAAGAALEMDDEAPSGNEAVADDGGCGCRTAGLPGGSAASGLGLLGLVGLLLARRRRHA